MAAESTLKRRSFVKLCASAVAAVSTSPEVLAREQRALNRYPPARLVDDRGSPLRSADLEIGETYLFPYPHATTPCFLLDLGKPAPGAEMQTRDGISYRWPGGVGPGRSLVAFSAICAHKMSHPARDISFINYRHRDVSFVGQGHETVRRPQVIYCCSEKSVYDPADGARVLGGPAPQPLAAILLEHDGTEDTLTAAGTFGGEMFERYFAAFSDRLALEYETDDVRAPVGDTSAVLTAAEFCKRQVLC